MALGIAIALEEMGVWDWRSVGVSLPELEVSWVDWGIFVGVGVDAGSLLVLKN
jgi:hypothetical protein